MNAAGLDDWDTSKEAFIQWKGTDVCMDLYCPTCSYHNHYDGGFAYFVKCAKCGALWEMNCFVTFKRAEIADGTPLTCEYEPEDAP
jgi:hypothetical protein